MNKIGTFAFAALLLAGMQACKSAKNNNETTSVVTPTTTTTSDLPYQVKVLKDGIPSPRKEMTTTVTGFPLVVNYGSPSVKGRTIMGGLVPYDKVWRTGANEATTFLAAKDVLVEGKKLAAGKYALFTIPKQSEWTIIFNKVADQWGGYEYDSTQDALRIDVKPTTLDPMRETLDFMVKGNDIVLQWEKIELPLSVAAAK